ncbi:MAG: hypothetical protein IRY85_21300 [Micromonosporaceae bacterium]|nr:hypothetical protein [Micromonosporaceae bacterium]
MRDTADTAPLPLVGEEYRGRRRARRRAGRLNLRWFVVVGVVAVLSAAVAVPFLVAEPAASPSGSGSVPASATSTGATPPSTTSSEPVTTQAGIPVIVAPSVTPTPAWSLTLQAESVSNNALGGGAAKRGEVVDYLGNWPNRRQSGWLEFRHITVPEPGAEYQLRVALRYETYCGCSQRQLEVWVNGAHVETWSFTDPDPGVRGVTVTLGAGENTIRLTHPSSPSPAVDWIEIILP